MQRSRLERMVVLGGITLPAGTPVELADEETDGQPITVAELLATIRIADLDVPAGSELEFDGDGNLTGATLGAPIDAGPIEGLHYDRGAFVGYDHARGVWLLSVDDAMGA